MTWKTRLMLKESAFTAVAFTTTAYAYYYFAFWSLQDHFVAGPIREYMTSASVHAEFLLAGVLFGGLIGVISRVTETPRFRRRPVIQAVMLRTLLYLAAFAGVASIVVLVFVSFFTTREELRNLTLEIGPRYAISAVAWFVVAVAGINLALELQRIVGPGNLWRLFVGRYRRPHVEQRVFLFMDLVGSTSATEQLGHRKYSEMVQECYRDLTEVVLRYEAAVYQYVGDEVVLSWPCPDRDDERIDSVHAFFAYQAILGKKKESYERRFGVVPQFRGGIAEGPVTVIEIGDVKREIAYHGDALNTAARLLNLCKEREDSLVVSERVGEAAQSDTDVLATWHGEAALRGKQNPVMAYSLDRPRPQ